MHCVVGIENILNCCWSILLTLRRSLWLIHDCHIKISYCSAVSMHCVVGIENISNCCTSCNIVEEVIVANT